MTVENIMVGNLLDSDRQTLVNTVNTVGVMGAGIAEQFKKRYPEMFDDYSDRCDIEDVDDPRKVVLGRPYVYRPPQTAFLTGDNPGANKWILIFPTKNHWRGPSRWNKILEGLDWLADNYMAEGIKSLAVPPLGCGHGGLEWNVVRPQLYERLDRLEIPVDLYAPLGTPAEELLPDAPSVSTSLPWRDASLAASCVVVDSESGRPLNRTELRSLHYWIGHFTGADPGLLEWGRYGIRRTDFSSSLDRLLNNLILKESESGGRFSYSSGESLTNAIKLGASELKENAEEVRSAEVAFVATRRLSPITPSAHWIWVTSGKAADAGAIVLEILRTDLRTDERRTLADVEPLPKLFLDLETRRDWI